MTAHISSSRRTASAMRPRPGTRPGSLPPIEDERGPARPRCPVVFFTVGSATMSAPPPKSRVTGHVLSEDGNLGCAGGGLVLQPCLRHCHSSADQRQEFVK